MLLPPIGNLKLQRRCTGFRSEDTGRRYCVEVTPSTTYTEEDLECGSARIRPEHFGPFELCDLVNENPPEVGNCRMLEGKQPHYSTVSTCWLDLGRSIVGVV